MHTNLVCTIVTCVVLVYMMYRSFRLDMVDYICVLCILIATLIVTSRKDGDLLERFQQGIALPAQKMQGYMEDTVIKSLDKLIKANKSTDEDEGEAKETKQNDETAEIDVDSKMATFNGMDAAEVDKALLLYKRANYFLCKTSVYDKPKFDQIMSTLKTAVGGFQPIDEPPTAPEEEPEDYPVSYEDAGMPDDPAEEPDEEPAEEEEEPDD